MSPDAPAAADAAERGPFAFTVEAVDGAARAGRLRTPHGTAATPAFMPVGTRAAVKGVPVDALRPAGAGILLANTYHLAVRPGPEVLEAFGGVARFMGWDGPTLTDSGGYQVFSLAAIRRIDDAGVLFRNHYDGAELHLTPERCMALQRSIGADIVMALDECPPGAAPREAVRAAMERTHRWAERCRAAWDPGAGQALFGIVQGGVHEDLRAESAGRIAALDLPGNAIGGVSVGESPEAMRRVVAGTAPLLPEAKPRYLMGVGRPGDLLHAIDCGVDMFDCVMPTRHARHGQAFTAEGTLNLKNARFRLSGEPIEPGCDCPACTRVSRAYLRHLLQVGEMLAPVLLTMHNLRHYLRLMEEARAAIRAGRWRAFHRERMDRLGEAESPLRDPS